MSERVPSFFMLVPGPWQDARSLLGALGERGVKASQTSDSPIEAGQIRVDVVEDARLAAGFAWGRQGALPEALLERLGACGHAALLECGQLLNGHPEQIAELGRALRDAGGIAVRMEASGGASEWEPWLVQLESGLPKRVYASGVVLVEDDDHVVFTCGMHHFDLPDAQIALPDSAEAIAWLDAFCSYQLEEDPVLQSGHTFRPDAQSESRVFERWPDHRHHPNDGRNNPFGLWRFREPGEKGVDPCNPLPVIIPTLVAQLMATERSKGTALTRREVDAFVAERPSIAMNPRDAASLERTRGYADIEPELAWEQWQIVRATL